MRKVFLSLLFLKIYLLSFGQNNIESLIPVNASNIRVFDGESITKLIDLDSLLTDEQKSDLYEDISDPEKNTLNYLPKALLKDGKNWGIDFSKKYYYYSYRTDSSSVTAYLFPLGNSIQLVDQINKSFPAELLEKKDKKLKYESIADESNVLFWSQQFVGYINANLDYSYLRNGMLGEGDYYIEELKESEKDKRDLQKGDLKEKYALGFLESLFEQNFDESIVSNENFMEMLSSNNFISNYKQMDGSLLPFPFSRNRYPSYGEMPSNDEDDEFKSYNITHTNIGGNGISKNLSLYLDPEYMDEIKKTFKAKQDKKLLNYIDATELSGFISATVSTPNLFKTIRMMQAKDGGSSSIDFRGIQQFTSSLMFELMDEKKLKKILPGKMIMAYTGKQEMDVKYLDYEFAEDGSQKRIIETKKEAMPEFVLAISLGNEKMVAKFLENLAQGEALQDLGSYYKIKGRNSYNSYGGYGASKGKTDTYLRYLDGILLISNDEHLLSTEAPSGGVPKEKRMQKEDVKNFKNFPFFAEMDLLAFKEYKQGVIGGIIPMPFESKNYTYQKISGPSFGEDFIKFSTELKSMASKKDIYESLISDILYSYSWNSEYMYESAY
jgi:hypothetical protein